MSQLEMKTNVVSERVWQTLRESSDLCLQVKHYSCSHRYLNSLRSLGGCHAYQLSQSASQSVWHFTVCWCPLLNKVSQGGFYRSVKGWCLSGKRNQSTYPLWPPGCDCQGLRVAVLHQTASPAPVFPWCPQNTYIQHQYSLFKLCG